MDLSFEHPLFLSIGSDYNGKLLFKFCLTNNMVADYFTKLLQGELL